MSAALQRLQAGFAKRNYSPQMGINQTYFYNLLDSQLGAPFDRSVAQYLWYQADLDYNGNAYVLQLCYIIVDAQYILVSKQREIDAALENLYTEQRQLAAQNSNLNPQQKTLQLQRISNQIQELYRDQRYYAEDLYLVSFPFGMDLGGRAQLDNVIASNLVAGQPLSPNNYLPHDVVPGMTILFGLSLVLTLLYIVVMFYKYDFLNLLVVVCILSIFLLNYFDKNYIILCMGLTGLSLILDAIWILVEGPKHWNPPAVGEFSRTQWGYLRVIWFFTVIQMAIKAGIVFLLNKQRTTVNTNQPYVIYLPKLTIFGNKSNIISQGVSTIIQNRF